MMQVSLYARVLQQIHNKQEGERNAGGSDKDASSDKVESQNKGSVGVCVDSAETQDCKISAANVLQD